MRRTDELELVGKRLFDGPLLADHLEGLVSKQVALEYAAITSARRRVTQLQVRRRFVGASIPAAAGIEAEPEVKIVGHAKSDERLVARRTCLITGNPGYLFHQPAHAMAARRPVAEVEGNRLMVTVLFEDEDRPSVAALVNAELELIRDGVERQREVVGRFNATFADLVRRLVAEQWSTLTGS